MLSAAQAEKNHVNIIFINTELSQIKDLFENLNVCYINYFSENKTEKEIFFSKYLYEKTKTHQTYSQRP
jgi:hypothetical protein